MINFKKAFTLAEVLITLGIIGVVAAMTIPTLMAKQRKTEVETSLKKFYSTMNQAILRSEQDNGDVSTWDPVGTGGTTTLNWFNKYLADYLQTLKVQINKDTNDVEIYFTDGSMISIYQTWNYFPKAQDFAKVTDNGTNQFEWSAKNRASDGKYYFAFVVNQYGKLFEPSAWSWDGNRNSLITNASWGCKNGNATHTYCTKLIQLNGWKIPDDYPIKF